MKKLIIFSALFLSVNLYGGTGAPRFFSPAEGEVRTDVSGVLFQQLDANPALKNVLKAEFIVAFQEYQKLSEVKSSDVINAKAYYLGYKKFVAFLVSQILQLGYEFKIIHNEHDNRQALLNSWLEVNLLSKYGNATSLDERDQERLYREVLPGFCFCFKALNDKFKKEASCFVISKVYADDEGKFFCVINSSSIIPLE